MRTSFLDNLYAVLHNSIELQSCEKRIVIYSVIHGDNDKGRPSKRQDDADHLEVCRFLIEGSCYTEHAGYYIFQNRFIFSLFPKVVLTCVRYATNLRAIYRQGFLGLNRKYIEHEAGYLLRASATNID